MRLDEVYRNSGLGKWFHGESANKTPGWDRYNSSGKRVGECGDAKKGDPYSACLSKQKAQKLGKEGIANFVQRKRAAQSEAGRGEKGTGGKGKKPIFVETGASEKKMNENLNKLDEGCGCGKPHPKGCQCDKCKGGKKSLFEKIKHKMSKTITEEAALNKPFRTPGGPKKFGVRVRNEKGNIITVRFGDPNMEIKRDDPNRRKNFRARHSCDDNPGPKTKARYWSCRMWEKGKSVSQLTKECMDFTELDLTPFRGKKIIIETAENILYGKLGVYKNNFAIFENSEVKKVLEPSEITKVICEGTTVLILEKNKPNDPDAWSDCKSQAKKKFDVYPSAYANAWASKCYKKKGGTWRALKEEKIEQLQEKILKRGDKWVVTDKAGKKILGTHSVKSKALNQLRAIEANKSRRMQEDVILTEKLKDKFFQKISEEIVNADNKGKLTPQSTNSRAKSRDKIEKSLGDVKVVTGPPGRKDTPEEARFRLATFIELNKGKGKTKKD